MSYTSIIQTIFSSNSQKFEFLVWFVQIFLLKLSKIIVQNFPGILGNRVWFPGMKNQPNSRESGARIPGNLTLDTISLLQIMEFDISKIFGPNIHYYNVLQWLIFFNALLKVISLKFTGFFAQFLASFWGWQMEPVFHLEF